jgi:hypothetical protein
MTANPFSDSYVAPKQQSKYLQLTEGSHLIRIITQASDGMSYFVNFVDNNDGTKTKVVTEDLGNGQSFGRLTWAFIVYNYELESTQVWECSQKAIQEFLLTLVRSKIASKKDWTKFDIEITRTGTGQFDTKYSVLAGDIEELSEDRQTKINQEIKKIDLKKLLTCEKPFIED